MARNNRKIAKKPVARSKIGRILKKPVESYHQNCVMMATVRENGRKKERARIQNVEKQRRIKDKKKMLQEQKEGGDGSKKQKTKQKVKESK